MVIDRRDEDRGSGESEDEKGAETKRRGEDLREARLRRRKPEGTLRIPKPVRKPEDDGKRKN